MQRGRKWGAGEAGLVFADSNCGPWFSRMFWMQRRRGQTRWEDLRANPAAQQNFPDGAGQLLGWPEAVCTVFVAHTGCAVHTVYTGSRFRPLSHYQCKHRHCVSLEIRLKSKDGSFGESSKFSTSRPWVVLQAWHNCFINSSWITVKL